MQKHSTEHRQVEARFDGARYGDRVGAGRRRGSVLLDEAVRGERVAKAAYDAALPQLRVDLLNAQYDLRSADFAAVVVVAGDDRQGANDTVNILHEWLDSRYLDTTVFRELTQEESERPRFWRTWMALPAKGRTGIWAGGVLRVINHRLDGNINDDELEAFARHLQRMQAELVADGTLVLKLWFHLPHAEHERRLKKAKKNPRLGWRVDELDWVVSERLPAATPLIERFLRETELPGVPWYVIDGTSWRSRNLTTGQLLRDAIVACPRRASEAKDAAAGAPRGSASTGTPVEPDRARQDRSGRDDRQRRVPQAAVTAASQALPTVDPGPRRPRVQCARVRGQRCEWQRRHDPATHPGNGGRRLQGDPHGGADTRGAPLPLSLAVLAPASPRWPDGDLRPLVVRARARRARRGLRHRGGMAARLRRDQRLRATDRRGRRLLGEVLAGHQPRGAARPFHSTPADPLQAAQDHR